MMNTQIAAKYFFPRVRSTDYDSAFSFSWRHKDSSVPLYQMCVAFDLGLDFYSRRGRRRFASKRLVTEIMRRVVVRRCRSRSSRSSYIFSRLTFNDTLPDALQSVC